MKFCSLILLLLVTACMSGYKSEQHLCSDFYVVEHESATGHSLVQRTGSDDLSKMLIEGDIAELRGNRDYIFAKQTDDNHVFYYVINTHYPPSHQASPVAKADFDTKLSNQKVEYHYRFAHK